ncbi:MAG: methyltransferase domain-containing protein [Myxococcales bacterium]|nr:methyltransferase domain-containing protein [Myxococcales bacterium]
MTLEARTPVIVEDALWNAARARLPAAVLGGPALTAAVLERSRRYTTAREGLRGPSGGVAAAADLAARALFFTVADAGKLHVPLAELIAGRAPAGFLDGPEVRVLDVGAGCGAMTLGLVTFLGARRWTGRLTVTLLDRDADALAIGGAAIREVAAAVGIACDLSARDHDVTAPLPRGTYDLIVARTVINELADGAALVAQLVTGLAPAGVAIVIEPALRDTSRGLHAIRDGLIAGGTATVLAPCTRRGAPCPALTDERDWCHDHRPAELPPRARQLATVTGLRDGDAKLAFLALARPSAAPAASAAWRVIDDPRAPKGKVELTVCGEAGWVAVRLLRRHRAPGNRAIERARRGDLLRIAPTPIDGAIELTSGDAVDAVTR